MYKSLIINMIMTNNVQVCYNLVKKTHLIHQIMNSATSVERLKKQANKSFGGRRLIQLKLHTAALVEMLVV